MSDVELVIAEVVEMHPWAEDAFPDQPKRMGRIEGWVNGKRYAAMVLPALAEDHLAAKSYLRWMAEREIAPATESPAEVLTTRAPVPARGALLSAGSVAGWIPQHQDDYWCTGCTAWVPNAEPCVHLMPPTAPYRIPSNRRHI